METNLDGGIHATKRRTKQASHKELFHESFQRLKKYLLQGVTTVEAKNGYGMVWETERNQLEVAKQLNEQHPIDVVSTFMGAHAVPKAYKDIFLWMNHTDTVVKNGQIVVKEGRLVE